MNFRIIYADSVSEDIGSVDVCVEQMNGELNEEMEIRVQTSPIGSTATGLFIIIMHVHASCMLYKKYV